MVTYGTKNADVTTSSDEEVSVRGTLDIDDSSTDALGVTVPYEKSTTFPETTLEDELYGNKTNTNEDYFTDVSVTDESVTDETVTDETVTDEIVTDETVTDETVTDETVTDETVTDETVTDENVTKENITNENYTEENVSDENVTDENFTEENFTEENFTEENFTEKNVTEENVTEENVTDNDIDNVSHKLVTNIGSIKQATEVTINKPSTSTTAKVVIGIKGLITHQNHSQSCIFPYIYENKMYMDCITINKVNYCGLKRRKDGTFTMGLCTKKIKEKTKKVNIC